MPRKPTQKRETIPNETAVKGRLVEAIVARMHDAPGLKVERNVRMLVPGSNRKREIDVLITADVVGNPVYVAIECKNYNKVIGVTQIDEFVGKLSDLGIPLGHGIYVTVRRFTSGAIERATKEGIRLLILTGLSDDRLAAQIQAAFQSVVFLLPRIEKMVVENNVDTATMSTQMLVFYDQAGRICGTVPGLIWRRWLEGYPPSFVGRYEFTLRIPPSWRQIVDGKTEPVRAITATVHVQGLLITILGEARQHTLVNPVGNKAEKLRIDASFDTSNSTFPVTTFASEAALSHFLSTRPEPVQVTSGRIRLPRVRLGPLYWPPSERVGSIFSSIIRDHLSGEIPDLASVDLSGIEGSDLLSVWEAIGQTEPMIQGFESDHAQDKPDSV